MLIKKLWCSMLTVIFLVACTAVSFAAAAVNVTVNDFDNPGPGVQSAANGNGAIDWRQGAIQVKGYGVAPTQYSTMPQAKIMARRAAIVDAYRNLAEAVQGVQVDADTTVQNFQVANDTVRARVAALIQGAQIIQEQPGNDGSYQVVMALGLYGDSSLGSVVFPAANVAAQPLPQPTTSVALSTNYTGLAVDVRGLGLEPVMAPKVVDQSGRVIYGNQYVDANYQVSKGLADYAFTDEDQQAIAAGTSRAGTTPLVVRAIALQDNNRNIVISNEDGDRILAANQRSHFIQRCAVVLEK